MQSIKKIYLHIGCGKTGSSALQVWLSNSVSELQAQGISYPLHKSEPLDDYSITSGNGFGLTSAIFDRNAERYFIRWAKQLTEEKILFSSERFQLLEIDDWYYFLDFAKSQNIEVQIIAFVRDVYDITYSSYQQLLKRHTYSDSFRDFALTQTTLQQFVVAEKMQQVGIDVILVHYDEVVRTGLPLSLPLADALGIDLSALPQQKNTKVNRSLSLIESQFMQMANACYKDTYGQPCFAFSSALSDRLINSDPELSTEIVYDAQIVDHLTKHMQVHVDLINAHFLNSPTLRICNRNNKQFCDISEIQSHDLKRIISMLIESELAEYHPDNLDKNGLPNKRNKLNIFSRF